MSVIEEHPLVGDIRQLGLLIGIESVEDKRTKQPAKAGKVKKILTACKEDGLIVGKNGDTVSGFNNVITFAPPLSCTDSDIAFLIRTIRKVFD